jgi:hypothetical protein
MPKGIDLSGFSAKDLYRIAYTLNNRGLDKPSAG